MREENTEEKTLLEMFKQQNALLEALVKQGQARCLFEKVMADTMVVIADSVYNHENGDTIRTIFDDAMSEIYIKLEDIGNSIDEYSFLGGPPDDEEEMDDLGIPICETCEGSQVFEKEVCPDCLGTGYGKNYSVLPFRED